MILSAAVSCVSLLALLGALAVWVERDKVRAWLQEFRDEIAQSWDVTP